MKQTIAWHQECLDNMWSSLEGEKHYLHLRRMVIERHERDIDLLTLQIAEAKKRGLTTFDSERLLKKRKR